VSPFKHAHDEPEPCLGWDTGASVCR
jgi:hypothetical protein